MAVFHEKYGIPANEVENLYSRFKKKHLAEGFGDFDNFLKFASESNYKPFLHLRLYDASRPHSPENSFFYDRTAKEKLPPKKPGTKVTDIVSPYCVGCKMKCPERGAGCLGWQMYFVRNWNKNICIRRAIVPTEAQKPPEPPKREFFRYEHPDLIRKYRKELADAE